MIAKTIEISALIMDLLSGYSILGYDFCHDIFFLINELYILMMLLFFKLNKRKFLKKTTTFNIAKDIAQNNRTLAKNSDLLLSKVE